MTVARPTKVSREGALQIAQREAFVPVAYPDGWHDPKTKKRPKWSIGFGDNSARKGDTIDLKEAFVKFNLALAERAAYVLKQVKGNITQEQLDGLVSAYYQGGNKKLLPIVRLMNEGKLAEAAEKFLDPEMATNALGEYRQGLRMRREREHAIFTRGDYGEIGWIWKYTGDPSDGIKERYAVREDDL